MLSKVSLKEVLMHYFPNMSPAYGGRWETSYPEPPNLPFPGKNPAFAHARLGLDATFRDISRVG